MKVLTARYIDVGISPDIGEIYVEMIGGSEKTHAMVIPMDRGIRILVPEGDYRGMIIKTKDRKLFLTFSIIKGRDGNDYIILEDVNDFLNSLKNSPKKDEKSKPKSKSSNEAEAIENEKADNKGKPTKKQIEYIKRLAEEKGIEINIDKIKTSKEASYWIKTLKKMNDDVDVLT